MEENRIHYYQDASHRYLVLSCGSEDTDNYRYRMLAVNQIPGLLFSDVRYIDGDCCIYYDVAGKQPLSTLSHMKKISGNACESLIRELVETEKKLTEFLLDATGLMLNPEYIYADAKTGHWFFAYNPSGIDLSNEDMSLRGLAEFLAYQIDPEDREIAALTFRLCTLSSAKNYVLDESIFEEEKDDLSSIISGGVKETTFSEEKPQEMVEEDYLLELESEPEEEMEDSAETKVSRKKERRHASDSEDSKQEITLFFVFVALAVFVLWFGNIMRLKNQDRIIDLAGAGTLMVCAVYFAMKNLLRKILKVRK